MTDDFYFCFGEWFRGTREEIKQRLTVYLPIIEPLKILQPRPATLDMGCGRGEWLELLSENGFSAAGVDSADTVCDFCREQGLDVRKADALECLGTVPDASLAMITGFHLAEHLAYETLRSLMREARRALMPGGILILETPNPENLAVGSCSFYTDPTHRVPLPPPLFRFLAEDAGFARAKVLRLNQPPEESYPEETRAPSLAKVVWGVSPDYSIVAQTHADLSTLGNFTWFDAPEDTRFSLGGRLEVFDTEMKRAVQQILSACETQRSIYETKMERAVQQILGACETQRRELEAVYASYSWRLTHPLRVINRVRKDFMRRPLQMFQSLGYLSKKMLKAILRPIGLRMLARPRLFYAVYRGLEPFPALRARLARIVRTPDTESAMQAAESETHAYCQTGRAARILEDLKQAISRKEG